MCSTRVPVSSCHPSIRLWTKHRLEFDQPSYTLLNCCIQSFWHRIDRHSNPYQLPSSHINANYSKSDHKWARAKVEHHRKGGRLDLLHHSCYMSVWSRGHNRKSLSRISLRKPLHYFHFGDLLPQIPARSNQQSCLVKRDWFDQHAKHHFHNLLGHNAHCSHHICSSLSVQRLATLLCKTSASSGLVQQPMDLGPQLHSCSCKSLQKVACDLDIAWWKARDYYGTVRDRCLAWGPRL